MGFQAFSTVPLPQALKTREFPGGLVVRIPSFHSGGPGSVPGPGIILHVEQCGQNKE